MRQILKWGILAPGEIALTFAKGLSVLEDHEIRAVGSRSLERAQALIHRQKLSGAIACGSYDELAQRQDFDIVYEF
ncbi:MAG: hypothetical protein EOM70_04380 [Clostridia bacterium]|nr:hypothetical protein [Clostridia bacterium]